MTLPCAATGFGQGCKNIRSKAQFRDDFDINNFHGDDHFLTINADMNFGGTVCQRLHESVFKFDDGRINRRD